MNSLVRIVYVITSTNIGGAEKILYHTVKGIDRHSYEVLVCSLKKGGEIARRIEQQGIDVKCLAMSEGEGLRGWLSSMIVFIRLAYYLLKVRPVIVHSFLFRANIISRTAAFLTRVPIVISSVRVMGGEKWYFSCIEKLTSFMVDCYIAVSEGMKSYLIKKLGVESGKVSVIYNGVEMNHGNLLSDNPECMQAGGGNGNKLLVTIGRLHRQKGFEYLIKAMALMKERYRNVTLMIVGEGEEKNCLKTLCELLDLKQKVIFTGVVLNVTEILSKAHVFVLPSLWEGMPNVLLEAMALGKPVIATWVGAIPEVVIDGVTGILVPPGDSSALASALDELLCDEGKAKKMGEASREHVRRNFALSDMIDKTESLYRELLRKKRLL